MYKGVGDLEASDPLELEQKEELEGQAVANYPIGNGNHTQIFCKTSSCFYPLSCVSSPPAPPRLF